MPQSDEQDVTRKLIRDYLSAVILAVLVALFIRFFIVEAYRIPSSVMKPTLEAGDTIFVAKSAYGIRLPWTPYRRINQPKLPKLGEVIIFSVPETPGRDFIKRVVAMPGDQVEITQGQLIINGNTIRNTATRDALCGLESIDKEKSYSVCFEPPALEDMPRLTVPADSVFVLGDLRSSATEQGKTQNWKIVHQDGIKGRALWIWLSVEPGGFEQRNFFPNVRFERMFRRIQ